MSPTAWSWAVNIYSVFTVIIYHPESLSVGDNHQFWKYGFNLKCFKSLFRACSRRTWHHCWPNSTDHYDLCMIVSYRTHFHVVVIVSLLQCDWLNSDWIFHYDKMKWGGSNIMFRKCTLSQSDVFPHSSTPHSFKLLNIMIPYFYLSPSLPPSLCPLAPHPHPLSLFLSHLSFPDSSVSKRGFNFDQRWNDCSPLSIFLFSPILPTEVASLSPQQLS